MPAIAYTPCPTCQTPIPITITSGPSRRPGEPITLKLDSTDMWAHAWTHEEQHHASQ